jgi:hypothetical protein
MSSQEPLLIYQPNNIAILLTFYSPLIITILILSISFVFQNFKGFGFLLWLILFSWIRSLILEVSGASAVVSKPGDICTLIQYSKYGNSTFSMFFIAFSLIYLCMPMVFNGELNYWIISSYLFYYLLDVGIRYSSGCISQIAYILLDTVCGLACGIGAVMALYATNNQKYLFFNELNSKRDICSRPSAQKFKCKVYKNGEVIGETSTSTSTNS